MPRLSKTWLFCNFGVHVAVRILGFYALTTALATGLSKGPQDMVVGTVHNCE